MCAELDRDENHAIIICVIVSSIPVCGTESLPELESPSWLSVCSEGVVLFVSLLALYTSFCGGRGIG